MPRVGLVALDTDAKWIGGRYYLHHLIRCVRMQRALDSTRLVDVWWGKPGPADAFQDVRELLDRPVVIQPPLGLMRRALRYARRRVSRTAGAGDLFRAQDVSVLFPIPPCEDPGIPYVFWLPDFQYIHMPELFDTTLRAFYESHYTKHVEAANAVVLSSEHAAADFRRHYPRHARKAHIVRFCSVPTVEWWERNSDKVAAQYGISDDYFVLSNQFSHHKNHGLVFEAARQMRDRGLRFTVACTGSTFGFRGQDYLEQLRGFIEEHRLEPEIRILGLLPRADQIALTRGARAVLQPSRFEGWSTIIEDARTLGARILASRIPVHVEQLGDSGGLLLPVDDASAWADAMSAMLRQDAIPALTEAECMVALGPRAAACAMSFVGAIRAALDG